MSVVGTVAAVALFMFLVEHEHARPATPSRVDVNDEHVSRGAEPS